MNIEFSIGKSDKPFSSLSDNLKPTNVINKLFNKWWKLYPLRLLYGGQKPHNKIYKLKSSLNYECENTNYDICL